ncbi:hypothetical protein JTB14_030928, partial [Gonioctena quinquepunctata]
QVNIKQVYYTNLEKAKEDVRKGEVIGVVHISEKFTENFQKRLRLGMLDNPNVINGGQIEVWMDLSNVQIGPSVQRKLVQLFVEFQESVFDSCQLPPELADLPINVDYIYDRRDDQYSVFMIPGGLVTMSFFIGAIMTCQIIVEERHKGIWDRSIVTGVKALEIIITHFILLATISMIQVLALFIITYVAYHEIYLGSIFLMYLIVYLQAVCGMGFGFCVSVLSTDLTMATLLTAGMFFPMVILNGSIWPIQGMPEILAFIARCLPFTIATESLRNVSIKGWSLTNANVINGIAMSLSWTLFFGGLSVYLMRKRR